MAEAINNHDLATIHSDSQQGRNRIAAAVLKLADKTPEKLDELVDKANYDYRDVLIWAEYSRCAKLGFGKAGKENRKQIYIDDLIEYAN